MFTLQKDLPENLSLITGGRATVGAALELAGVPLRQFPLDHTFAQFELSLLMTESQAGLDACFEYNVDLFDAGSIERLAGHFETLLAGIVATPDARIGHLPLLTDSERQQLKIWAQPPATSVSLSPSPQGRG